MKPTKKSAWTFGKGSNDNQDQGMSLTETFANSAAYDKCADKSLGRPDVDLSEHIKATGQQHLAQAEILQECFQALRNKDLIEEGYLRGSLGRGKGDEHSDIDLFAVIDPEKINEAYDTVNAYLEQRGGIALVCHDRLVEDYGGIGFMYIARDGKNEGANFQFDFYMALKGQPPKKPTTIKPRFFHKDENYKWTDTYGEKRAPLPQVTQDFMDKYTEGDSKEERMELLFKEMLVNMYVTCKHIKRGQNGRLNPDNAGIIQTAVDMIQMYTRYHPTGYSNAYIADEVAELAMKHGQGGLKTGGQKLKNMLQPSPVDKAYLKRVLEYSKHMFEKTSPERYKTYAKSIDFFENELLKEQSKNPMRRFFTSKKAGHGK